MPAANSTTLIKMQRQKVIQIK